MKTHEVNNVVIFTSQLSLLSVNPGFYSEIYKYSNNESTKRLLLIRAELIKFIESRNRSPRMDFSGKLNRPNIVLRTISL